MKVNTTAPGQVPETLIDVAEWNYNWQDEYYYDWPFSLPAGTVLKVEAVYDTSSKNPSNVITTAASDVGR